jgi:hypothetical protein
MSFPSNTSRQWFSQSREYLCEIFFDPSEKEFTLPESCNLGSDSATWQDDLISFTLSDETSYVSQAWLGDPIPESFAISPEQVLAMKTLEDGSYIVWDPINNSDYCNFVTNDGKGSLIDQNGEKMYCNYGGEILFDNEIFKINGAEH